MDSPAQSLWSRTVRLTHWLVAICVIVNFFNETGEWHRNIGYACLALVVIRLAHGFGARSPVSSQFYWPTFRLIKQHIQEIFHQKTLHYNGHNPLGQWAVYCIWALIVLLAFTGWLSRTDQFWGEDWPVDLHTFFSNALQGLVLLHLAAVVLMSRLQRKNLIGQMVAGK